MPYWMCSGAAFAQLFAMRKRNQPSLSLCFAELPTCAWPAARAQPVARDCNQPARSPTNRCCILCCVALQVVVKNVFHWTQNHAMAVRIAKRKEEIYDELLGGVKPAEVRARQSTNMWHGWFEALECFRLARLLMCRRASASRRLLARSQLLLRLVQVVP